MPVVTPHQNEASPLLPLREDLRKLNLSTAASNPPYPTHEQLYSSQPATVVNEKLFTGNFATPLPTALPNKKRCLKE